MIMMQITNDAAKPVITCIIWSPNSATVILRGGATVIPASPALFSESNNRSIKDLLLTRLTENITQQTVQWNIYNISLFHHLHVCVCLNCYCVLKDDPKTRKTKSSSHIQHCIWLFKVTRYLWQRKICFGRMSPTKYVLINWGQEISVQSIICYEICTHELLLYLLQDLEID